MHTIIKDSYIIEKVLNYQSIFMLIRKGAKMLEIIFVVDYFYLVSFPSLSNGV